MIGCLIALELLLAPGIPAAEPAAQPLQRGSVNILMADRARFIGAMKANVVWGKPEGRFCVENWKQAGETFQWSVEAPDAGRYEVELLIKGKAGDELELSSGSAAIKCQLPSSGWDKVKVVDSLPLAKGSNTVSLKLLKPGNLQLKSIELVYADDRPDLERRLRAFRAPTQWLSQCKYGVMFQWGGWGYPRHGDKKPWPKQIDDFDVKAFGDMIDQTGAGYVIWSATWCTYHFPAPIKAIDAIAPGHTSGRDLIGEIADDLGRRGIKLMLYYHEGHPDSDFWPKNKVKEDLDRKQVFTDNLCNILNEVGDRYGSKLTGWFFDDGMLYYPADFERIGQAAKKGFAGRLISLNSWVLPRLTEFQEMYMGEGYKCTTATPADGVFDKGPQKGLFGQGMFVLDGARIGGSITKSWRSNRPA